MDWNESMAGDREEHTEAQRKVIEAARRALSTLRDCSRVTAGGSDEEIDSLTNAIEALQAAEGK